VTCRGRIHSGRRVRIARAIFAAVILASAFGCQTRPVPHLDREIEALEELYRSSLRTEDPVLQARELLDTRRGTENFLARLDGEQVLLPHASARGSTETNSGLGMFRVERRDIAGVRSRTVRLLHRIDRFLTTTGQQRLAGSGYKIAEGQLVEE
jgi:hypothetical protein